MTRPALLGPASQLTANLRYVGFYAAAMPSGLPGITRPGRRRQAGPPFPVVDYGVGRAVAGQKDAVITPAGWRPDKAVPPVLLCHGNLGHRDTFLQATAWRFPLALLNRGLPVVACDGDGAPAFVGSAFWNDASQAAHLATVDWAADLIGCDPDHFLILGTSMGSGTAFNLQKNNPERVLATAHMLVTTSEQAVYNASAAGDGVHKAQMDQAYSDVPGGWAAVAATHDPGQFYSELTGLPIWLGDTTDDPFNGGQSGVNQLAAAIGGSAVDGPHYYGTGGHVITGISEDDPAEFLFVHSGLAA